MQTAHAQSQPGGSGQKHSPGLLNNIWSQSESSGWPTTSSSSGWSQPSHIQNSISSGGGSDMPSSTNELGWGGGTTPSIGSGASTSPSPWGPPTSRAPTGADSLVVDTHDKEAWPSIGNDSETGSNIDEVETGSAKSGSVISSSSNPGMSSLGDSLSTSSGLPAQNASSSMGWGGSPSAFGSATDSKIDGGTNNWGLDSANALGGSGSGMWGASQANSLGSGWGSSGVVGARDGADLNGSSAGGWQGMNFSGGGSSGMNLQQNATASTADVTSGGWGAPNTSSTSVIASSISSSLGGGSSSTIGDSILQSSTNVTAGAAASGWGATEPPKPDAQGSGWGSPSTTPVLMNTGTEAWGQPKKQTPNMSSWGQANQPTTTTSATTGWGQPEPAKTAPGSAGGWGEPTKPSNTAPGWGQPTEQKSNTGAWGQASPDIKPDAAASTTGWGAAPKPPQTQSQWGATPASSVASSWGAQSASQPPATNSWGASAPPASAPGNVQQQLPRPIGAAQPAQPSSWADAASRNLPPKALERTNSRDAIIQSAVDNNDGWGKTPVRQDTSWDMDESPKLPRKPLSSTSSNSSQDNTWNQPNDGTAIWETSKLGGPGPPPPQQVPAANQWGNQAAGRAPQAPAQPVGPASSTHWGNPDADGGNWEGPPDARQNSQSQNTNMWNGPPNQGGPQNNQWGSGDEKSGHWGSGSSGSDWGSNKSDNGHGPPPNQQWNNGAFPKRDDNPWDRDGNQNWAGNAPPPQRSNSTDMASWGAGGDNRNASSWGDRPPNQPAGNWNRNGPPPPTGNVDNGTAYWGDPKGGSGSWASQAPRGPPPPDNRPVWAQPPKSGWEAGQQGPPKNDTMWGQEPPKPQGSWGDATVSGWSAMKPRQPAGPGVWGDVGGMNDMSKPPPQPQMRSRMLQQLTNMGFKKDEAQRALINSNMNLERAIRELVSSTTQDGEQKGRPLRSVHSSREDINLTDPHVPLSATDLNTLVPPPMPGNPVVAGLANPQLAALHMKQQQQQQQAGSSLPPTSSLTAPSIIPMLQKQLAQVGMQPSPQGQPIRGPMPNPQYQILHSQLTQQLQLAVQTGLVSPQLLNQDQLPPKQLILLQELLQVSQLHQRFLHQQQVVQQSRQLTPLQRRQQLEKINAMITRLKQAMVSHTQLLHNQYRLGKQPGTSPQAPNIPGTMPTAQGPQANFATGLQAQEVANELANLQLTSTAGQTATSTAQQGSRLTQWIKDSNNQANAGAFKQSSSTPNLQAKDDVSAGLLSDSTWSPSVGASTTLSWPASGTDKVATSSAADVKIRGAETTSSVDMANLSTADQMALGAAQEDGGAALDIVEFVPGKQWQGMQKSIEDDPFLTPASISRSLSVSQVREDQLSILGGNKSSASSPGDVSGGGGWGGSAAGKQWSTGGGDDWTSNQSNAATGLNASTTTASVTGRMAAGSFNRSMSMPASAAGHTSLATDPSVSQGQWLVLKNISQRMGPQNLESLIEQYGQVVTMIPNPAQGMLLVCYRTRDSALRAHAALNNMPYDNAILSAEFLSDNDGKYIAMAAASSQAGSSSGLWSTPQDSLVQEGRAVSGRVGGGARTGAAPPVRGNLWSSGGGVGGGADMWLDGLNLGL